MKYERIGAVTYQIGIEEISSARVRRGILREDIALGAGNIEDCSCFSPVTGKAGP